MSMFKKFANFCRESNQAADERNKRLPPRAETRWVWQSCSTCHYLDESNPIHLWDDSCGGVRLFYYCPKHGYIDPDKADEQKCDKYLSRE